MDYTPGHCFCCIASLFFFFLSQTWRGENVITCRPEDPLRARYCVGGSRARERGRPGEQTVMEIELVLVWDSIKETAVLITVYCYSSFIIHFRLSLPTFTIIHLLLPISIYFTCLYPYLFNLSLPISIYFTHLYPYLSILPIFISICIISHLYLLLTISIITRLYLLLSIPIYYCPSLSVTNHIYLLLPIFIYY